MARRPPPRPPPWHREIATVGVTGTNGKTTTATFVAAALGALGGPVARITTVGRFIDDEELHLAEGYPGFLATMETLRARSGSRAAIELTSEALALGFAIAWPSTVGVFTNLTRDHLNAHGSAEHYLASKAQLFVHLPPGGTAVLNARDPAGELLAGVVPPPVPGASPDDDDARPVRIATYGVRSRGASWQPADLEASRIVVDWEGTEMALDWKTPPPSAPTRLKVRAIGEVFAENAIAALLAAMAAGVDATAAADRIAACAPPAGRFEVVAREPFVVVDYAHTPDALQRAIATARTLAKGRVIVIFGAGGERDRGKRPAMGAAAAAADRIVLTSDNSRSEDPASIAEAIRSGIPEGVDVMVELDRARAIESTVARADRADVVVVAGKGHERYQTAQGEAKPFSDGEIAARAHALRWVLRT